MEDMATGEIRLSILWEWIHKGAGLTADDPIGVKTGDRFTADLFGRLLEEEYEKLVRADPRDVHENSKTTTLPISKAIVDRYVREPMKLPWFIDLLNLTLGAPDLDEARRRIDRLARLFAEHGTRLTTLPEPVA